MEKPTRTQGKEENISNSNESSNASAVQTGTRMPPRAVTPRPNPPITIIPTPNPYNTPIIHTDKAHFKEVVQLLTLDPKFLKSNTEATSSRNAGASSNQQQEQGLRIYERRNHHSNPLTLNPVAPGGFTGSSSSSPSYGGYSPHQIISPSTLGFHQLALSPAAQLNPFDSSSSSSSSYVVDEEAERKGIAEKGFYLHPSPRRGGEPPQLLQLFPLTSPKSDENAKRD